MKLLTFTYFAPVVALLSACTASSPPPSVGTTQYNAVTRILTVAQDGTNYEINFSNPFSVVPLPNGESVFRFTSASAATTGYAVSYLGAVAAAGLDNGTYFAGIPGTAYTGTLPIAGFANLTGAYAFIVNGTSQEGALALTADFGASTFVSTSAGVSSVSGTISGININGTMTVAGETGALSGVFYKLDTDFRVIGAAVGANMAGVLHAQ